MTLTPPNGDLLINNRREPAAASLDVANPATDAVLGQVADATQDDARRAADAAASALPEWSRTPAAERGEKIAALAALMKRDEDHLAALMTAEQGKPLKESRGEIAYARSFLEWAAAEGQRLYGDITPAGAPEKRVLALRQPVGVCALITPWNFPAAMITRKLGPALACGCTAVVKPAELTPYSALAIGELAIEAGLPPGAVNIVTTSDAAAIGVALFNHPAVRKVSFTGSTAVGSKLIEQSAERVVNLSLELGGHAPLIVFDDADLDLAAEQAAAAKFRNGGQTCIAPNRFYVHEDVHEDFLDKLLERVDKIAVGPGDRDGVDLGPMINDDAINKIERHVKDATDRGATLLRGGRRARPEGDNLADRFYEPTVLDGFTPEMELAAEETFGPVIPIARFKTEEEAVRLANDSVYGLAAYFFTENASRLARVAEALEYGIVGANDGLPSAAQAPFGGFKRSGLGREGGKYVMDEYTETKYVSLRIDPDGARRFA